MHPGRWAAMMIMLVGLPPLGVLLRGGSLAPYVEFPPRSRFINHAPFSWIVFSLIAVLAIASTAPLIKGLLRHGSASTRPTAFWPFPWWGWAGVTLGAAAWGLAWTRFPWFAAWQPHTFPMLWTAFILVVNGLTLRRTGACPLTARPYAFSVLFPVSAGFWWVFEYFNRFVQNWYYSGVEYSPATYFALATLSFATVLPAVLSVREWLLSYPRVSNVLRGQRIPSVFTSATTALWALSGACAGLVLAGAAPDYGFPFVWVSPLIIMMALQVQEGRCVPLREASRGHWERLASAALAGLVCGFFWEMWNYFSLARWSYTVPFVDRFHLFEMPLLGYAGYLPFGWLCALIGDEVLFGPGKASTAMDKR